MRVSLLALALLMASPTFAQSAPAPSEAATTSQTASPTRAACPVGFFAQRKGAWSTVVTKGPDGSDLRLGMGLDLSFQTHARAVVEADVTVHGMTARPRVTRGPLREFDDDAEDFVLKGTAEEPVKLSSVWMNELGTVSWVELTRVVFADGTAWTPSGSAHCITRPSMMVLVGGAAQAK